MTVTDKTVRTEVFFARIPLSLFTETSCPSVEKATWQNTKVPAKRPPWWQIPVIPAPGRKEQETQGFKVILDSIVSLKIT